MWGILFLTVIISIVVASVVASTVVNRSEPPRTEDLQLSALLSEIESELKGELSELNQEIEELARPKGDLALTETYVSEDGFSLGLPESFRVDEQDESEFPGISIYSTPEDALPTHVPQDELKIVVRLLPLPDDTTLDDLVADYDYEVDLVEEVQIDNGRTIVFLSPKPDGLSWMDAYEILDGRIVHWVLYPQDSFYLPTFREIVKTLVFSAS